MRILLIAITVFTVFSANAIEMKQRLGARYSALPEGCPVLYISNTGDVNMAEYERLGHVTLSGTDGFSADAKEDLAPTICKWGGDAVSIMSSGEGMMGGSATTFSILKKRKLSASSPMACTGSFGNSMGTTVVIESTGKASMAYGGSASTCNAQSPGGHKIVLTCAGYAQDGSFASDCSKVTLSGMDYNRK